VFREEGGGVGGREGEGVNYQGGIV